MPPSNVEYFNCPRLVTPSARLDVITTYAGVYADSHTYALPSLRTDATSSASISQTNAQTAGLSSVYMRALCLAVSGVGSPFVLGTRRSFETISQTAEYLEDLADPGYGCTARATCSRYPLKDRAAPTRP